MLTFSDGESLTLQEAIGLHHAGKALSAHIERWQPPPGYIGMLMVCAMMPKVKTGKQRSPPTVVTAVRMVPVGKGVSRRAMRPVGAKVKKLQ